MDTIIQMDKQLLLAINGSDSLFVDYLAKTLTTAATWIPLYVSLFYVVVKNNDNFRRIICILACAGLCVLFAGTVDDLLVKPLVARLRPTHDFQIGMLVDTVDGYRGGKYGFFSAHAANTFSIAVFFSLLMRSRLVTLLLVGWSLTNCWTRLYLGVHYPLDILCGLLWGGSVGTGIYFLYRYVDRRLLHSENDYVSSKYTSSGYRYSDIYIVALVLSLTLIYCILRSLILA
ncbi:MAG: phosphatase PAP2 family protein [Prevotella sp.]|nr:phosphatase PAP2 family protein [Prevotella sp.]MCI7017966.1 phosphatase PAP2 family protein [Prevotella sp.]MCI7579000.1 phosphatase PAP2 family protein [Prevotella sp.]MDY4556091.1 phosphatase PAP2 family protein [Prevotella sp.]MDY4629707.1 phosphatase PAP2 family protein [Prevotella sp.]